MWVTGRPQTSAHTWPSCRGNVKQDCSDADVLRFPPRSTRGPGRHDAYACRPRPDRRRWSPSSEFAPIAVYLFFTSRFRCAIHDVGKPNTKLTLISLKSASLLNQNALLRTHLSRSCTKIWRAGGGEVAEGRRRAEVRSRGAAFLGPRTYKKKTAVIGVIG